MKELDRYTEVINWWSVFKINFHTKRAYIAMPAAEKSHLVSFEKITTTSRPWRYTAHAQMILPCKQPTDASPYVRGTPTPTPGRHVWYSGCVFQDKWRENLNSSNNKVHNSVQQCTSKIFIVTEIERKSSRLQKGLYTRSWSLPQKEDPDSDSDSTAMVCTSNLVQDTNLNVSLRQILCSWHLAALSARMRR